MPAGFIALHIYIGKEEKAISEVMDIVMYGVAFLCLAIIPTFLWNLWLAPYRLIEKRLENEINAIRNSTQFIPSNVIEEPEKVDVSDFQNHSNLMLYEAACLWVGLEPHFPIRNQEARTMLSQLKSAIRSHQLSCPWRRGLLPLLQALSGTMEGTPGDEQIVSMIALRRYAEKIGKVPMFLLHISLPPEPSDDEGESRNKSKELSVPITPDKSDAS